jgi:large subunit ribosomal protein L1
LMAQHGKKFEDAAKQVDRNKQYAPAEAVDLLKQISYTKFNETVEVHVRLGVDPRHADQQVRSTVLLPAGLGKECTFWSSRKGTARGWPSNPEPTTWASMT